MMTIQVDDLKCSNCGICQAVCSIGHSKNCNEGVKNVEGLHRPLIWIDNSGGEIDIDICRQCEIPLCVSACVAGAIKIDERAGIVSIDGDKCVGCWSCVMECPFGALKLHTVEENVSNIYNSRKASKCDGCEGWDIPLCARFCPTGALRAERKTGITGVKRRARASIIGFGKSFVSRVKDYE